nr:integrase core domain-containing protein [Methanotorris formicicus]
MFNSLEEFVDWYNRVKPHRSLNFKTPYEVYYGVECDKKVISV